MPYLIKYLTCFKFAKLFTKRLRKTSLKSCRELVSLPDFPLAHNASILALLMDYLSQNLLH